MAYVIKSLQQRPVVTAERLTSFAEDALVIGHFASTGSLEMAGKKNEGSSLGPSVCSCGLADRW